MLIDLPTVGDIILSPHDKVMGNEGNDKYDLLVCDGVSINVGTHPLLFAIRTTAPNIADLDPRVPYKIVGDLT